jgi:hypothetical protein
MMMMMNTTLLIFSKRTLVLNTLDLQIVKSMSTTKATLFPSDSEVPDSEISESEVSDNENSGSGSPRNENDMTEHERFSAEYRSNLFNKPAGEIPKAYLFGYRDTLEGNLASIDDDDSDAEEDRLEINTRLEEIKAAMAEKSPLRSEEVSPSSSSDNTDNLSETDRFGALHEDLRGPRDNNKSASPSEENVTGIESSSTKKRKLEEEEQDEASNAHPASRFKQDSSDITSDSEMPDIFEFGGE